MDLLFLTDETKEIKLRIGGREEILKADQPSGILSRGIISRLICAVIGRLRISVVIAEKCILKNLLEVI